MSTTLHSTSFLGKRRKHNALLVLLDNYVGETWGLRHDPERHLILCEHRTVNIPLIALDIEKAARATVGEIIASLNRVTVHYGTTAEEQDEE